MQPKPLASKPVGSLKNQFTGVDGACARADQKQPATVPLLGGPDSAFRRVGAAAVAAPVVVPAAIDHELAVVANPNPDRASPATVSSIADDGKNQSPSFSRTISEMNVELGVFSIELEPKNEGAVNSSYPGSGGSLTASFVPFPARIVPRRQPPVLADGYSAANLAPQAQSRQNERDQNKRGGYSFDSFADSSDEINKAERPPKKQKKKSEVALRVNWGRNL